MAIAPVDNLVTNIEFGPAAASYKTETPVHALLPTSPMQFPLRHPNAVAISEDADLLEWQLLHPRLMPRSLWRRAGSYLRRRRARIARAASIGAKGE